MLPQQLNIRCNELAKVCLIDPIADGIFINPVFPDKDITVTITTTKVRSSVKATIYKHWGACKAKNLFSQREKVLHSAFDNIYWDCMGKVMNEFPETFEAGSRATSPISTVATAIRLDGTNQDAPAATYQMKTPNTLPAALTPPVPHSTMMESDTHQLGSTPTIHHPTLQMSTLLFSKAKD
ncbi:LOW QUALITY PROTEIN: hypothetical protein ACHAW6_003004 [Cyclotella cf. meneghiniana]